MRIARLGHVDSEPGLASSEVAQRVALKLIGRGAGQRTSDMRSVAVAVVYLGLFTVDSEECGCVGKT